MKGSSGDACTSVITEFQQAWPGQLTPFRAEIQLFEPEQIEGLSKEHHRAYCNHVFGDKDGFEQDLLDEMELKSKTALEVFQALFADHQIFRNETAANSFLGGSKNTTEEADVISKLVNWTIELASKHDAQDTLIYKDAHTAADLGVIIEPFIKTTTLSGEDDIPCPSVWPIVQIVKYVQ